MDKKKNKKKDDTFYSIDGLTFNSGDCVLVNDGVDSSMLVTVDTSNSVNYTLDSSDITLYTTGTATSTFTFTNNTQVNDPYFELEEFRSEQEEDEKLREENPSLQDAYDQYQLIKKLVQEEECDKYFHDKMKVFKK